VEGTREVPSAAGPNEKKGADLEKKEKEKVSGEPLKERALQGLAHLVESAAPNC